MKKIVVVLVLVCSIVACENPYENVLDNKYYDGDPFVSLSSEQAVIRLGTGQANNQPNQVGMYKDSLVLSHKLDHDISVTLELVDYGTYGDLDINFSFQKEVIIKAGDNYGAYLVQALELSEEEMSKYKLAIRIMGVDDQQVIAGFYGIKKENEERKKRLKTYSFQK